MNKTELAEAAAVLKALTRSWTLMDYGSKLDFLVFVNEDREELDFYPKKSFVRMMESAGLIENSDLKGSSLRKPYTHYETDGSVWKKITEEGVILFEYRVTPKGLKLLRDAPKLVGEPIRTLTPANPPIDTKSEPLSVETYDRAAIRKLVDAFDQKVIALIGLAIYPVELDRPLPFYRGVVCGPKLWKMIEPAAKRNGLNPSGSRVRQTFSLAGPMQKETKTKLGDQPLGDVRLFWSTFRQEFKIDRSFTVRRATRAEWSTYSSPEEWLNDPDFPPPDLALLSVFYIVEKNTTRFLILVRNEPLEDMEHFQPEVSWVEIISQS